MNFGCSGNPEGLGEEQPSIKLHDPGSSRQHNLASNQNFQQPNHPERHYTFNDDLDALPVID